MTKQEISLFIEIMKTAVGEEWTPEEVEEKYGGCETLREAVARCINAGQSAIGYLEEMVKEDLAKLEQKQS